MDLIEKLKEQETRQETDSLGEVNVASSALWGGANPTVARTFQHWTESHPARDDRGIRDSKEGRRKC